MKIRFLAATALVAFAGVAQAADLPSTKGPPIVPILAAYSWQGVYVGLHAGIAASRSGSITELAPLAATDLVYNLTGGISRLRDETNFLGGAQIGAQFQFSSIVLGIEADISGMGYNVSAPQVNPLTNALLAGGDTIGRKKAGYLGTIRGRLGIAFDRFLIYATGGYAFSDLKYSIVDNCIVAPCGGGRIAGSVSASSGYVVGGGAEYAFTNNWSFKGEYLYNHFDAKTFRGNILTIPGSTSRFGATDTVFHVIRVGVNYKF